MLSARYHAIFDFQLVKSDLPKWLAKGDRLATDIATRKDKKRIEREKISQKKLQIAEKAASVLEKIPSVKFVGVTGALAMMNAKKESDIDLLLIAQTNTLWLTRILAHFVLKLANYELRKPHDKNEEDKLCLNAWLDESDLIWPKKDRNIYTAHEIAQITPLVNKNSTYEEFLNKNKWLLNYWPNSINYNHITEAVNAGNKKKQSSFLFVLYILFEKAAFGMQYMYMRRKVTREVITPTRALFHPRDWGQVVTKKLAL